MKILWRLALCLAALGAAPATAFAQWENPSRAFHKDTAFPLEGRHLTVACASCHLDGQMKGTPTKCYDCHWVRRQDDLYRTRLGTACEQCHRPTAWTAVRWDHAAATGQPLNAAHRTVGCQGCHRNGQFSGVPVDCISCHRRDYDATRSPNHAAAGFSTACDSCHKPSDVTFARGHFTHTTFQLVGQHATAPCSACHVNNIYRGTPTSCFGCHKSDYDKSANPNHAAAGFSTSCETCHKAIDATWHQGSGFNHNQFFVLTGVHVTQACSACHKNGIYKGTPTTCVGCHKTDYDRTTAPNHAQSGIPTTCESCHKASDPSWDQGSGFNHNQFYPLVGVHATQPCAACHKNNVYPGTPTTCVGCHRTDYDRTSKPNHASAGFPTTCDSCHKPTDATWNSGTMNHNQFFQLVGVHATAPCTACHINGVYKGTARDCYGCHRPDYDRTSNPSHSAAGFPTSCTSCHNASDSSWTQGKFNHTWFPITSGRHSGNPCSACHQNPSNYSTFTCLTCHTKTQTDNQHKGRNGYQYDSNRCYACHPTGRAGLPAVALGARR